MFEYFKALMETGKEVTITITEQEGTFRDCTIKTVLPDCIIIKTKSEAAYLIAMSHIIDVYLGDAHD